MLSAKSLPWAVAALALYAGKASAHASPWHPAMWGFDVRMEDFPYDNRPQAPLSGRTRDQWFAHGHQNYPPAPGQFVDLPAGGTTTLEISCNRGATSYFNALTGGDQRQGDNPCPGEPTTRFHAIDVNDVRGCGLGIVYKSDLNQVSIEDFAIFSIQHQCVWNRFTPFDVPAAMPQCPPEGCICGFFWLHDAKAGGPEMFLNFFRCKVSGATGTVAIGKPVVPVECSNDPGKCTHGAKMPFVWHQAEGNNIFTDDQNPPLYGPSYGYQNGAQTDIFTGGQISGSNSGPASNPPPSSSSSAPVQTQKTEEAPASTQPASTQPAQQPPQSTTPVQEQPQSTTPAQQQPQTTPTVQPPPPPQTSSTAQQQNTTPAQQQPQSTSTQQQVAPTTSSSSVAVNQNNVATTTQQQQAELSPTTTSPAAQSTSTRHCRPRNVGRSPSEERKRAAAVRKHKRTFGRPAAHEVSF